MLAGTYHRLPHEVLAPLVPELAHLVTPLDWYLFDVEATRRYFELRAEAQERATEDARATESEMRRDGAPPAVTTRPQGTTGGRRLSAEAREALRRRAERMREANARAQPPQPQPPPQTRQRAPTAGGRRPPTAGRIRVMGHTIAAEIPPWDPRYQG